MEKYNEKKGTNNFDINSEFFIIDSYNIGQIKTKFYGYSVQESGIYENENFNDKAAKGLDGLGAYLYVQATEDKITITQDANGSYGLYLFTSGDYFALSSSFLMLVEHIKDKYHLTINRDYANMILANPLATVGVSQTAINEITMIDNHDVVTIDKGNPAVVTSHINYEEDSYQLDTEAGLRQLDKWYNKWTKLFPLIKKYTNNISASLSGGMDSRITFMLVLKSGINLNEIRIDSINNNLHTHAEDYRIATLIANYFNFKLNNVTMPLARLKYTLQDTVNICFYNKIFAHKEMYYKYGRYQEKRFSVLGYGGEGVRAHWGLPAGDFIKDVCKCANRYSDPLRSEIKESITKLITDSYKQLDRMYHFDSPDSCEYPDKLYKHGRCRAHFGKASVDDFFTNTYNLTPLMDPDLLKICLTTKECSDKNLLMAVIYVRYCPELLQFEFDGKRSISQQTIEYATSLNAKFPFAPSAEDAAASDFVFNAQDEAVVAALKSCDKNDITATNPDPLLKEVFDSQYLQNLFATYFDSEFCGAAQKHYQNIAFYPLKHIYPIIAFSKLLEIITTDNLADFTLLGDLNRYIANDSGCVRNGNIAELKLKLQDAEKRIAELEKSVKDKSLGQKLLKEKYDICCANINLKNKELEKAQNNIQNLKLSLVNANKLIQKIKSDLANIKSGLSFKIGRCITFIPRKLLGRK